MVKSFLAGLCIRTNRTFKARCMLKLVANCLPMRLMLVVVKVKQADLALTQICMFSLIQDSCDKIKMTATVLQMSNFFMCTVKAAHYLVLFHVFIRSLNRIAISVYDKT